MADVRLDGDKTHREIDPVSGREMIHADGVSGAATGAAVGALAGFIFLPLGVILGTIAGAAIGGALGSSKQ